MGSPLHYQVSKTSPSGTWSWTSRRKGGSRCRVGTMGPGHSSGACTHFWEKSKQLLSDGKRSPALNHPKVFKYFDTFYVCSWKQPGNFHHQTSPSAVSHRLFTTGVTSSASPGSSGAPISLVCGSYVSMWYPQRCPHARWLLPLKALTSAKCNISSLKILYSFS